MRQASRQPAIYFVTTRRVRFPLIVQTVNKRFKLAGDMNGGQKLREARRRHHGAAATAEAEIHDLGALATNDRLIGNPVRSPV